MPTSAAGGRSASTHSWPHSLQSPDAALAANRGERHASTRGASACRETRIWRVAGRCPPWRPISFGVAAGTLPAGGRLPHGRPECGRFSPIQRCCHSRECCGSSRPAASPTSTKAPASSVGEVEVERRAARAQTVGPAQELAACDSHLVTRVVERHEPALLESKHFPRAQDRYRADSDSFTEPEDGDRSATVAAVLLRHTFGRFINRELKSVSPSHKRLALGGQSLLLLARRGFL